jgi:general secretion pathway protein A
MYEAAYGLADAPFALHPDPRRYVDLPGHHTALAYLRYGLMRGEGFVVLTGEPGTGKTLLVQTALAGADPAEVASAVVACTPAGAEDLLASVLAAFGVAAPASGQVAGIAALEAHLDRLRADGRRALLVVDEAQNLSDGAIELLRLLTNLQRGADVLLQVFLVGQPALAERLRTSPLDGLRQRITASCRLQPLDASGTRAYVEGRLRAAGGDGRPAFDEVAWERLHVHGGGVPRRLNRLVHRTLLAASLGQTLQVTAALVDQVAGEIESEVGPARGVSVRAAESDTRAVTPSAAVPSSRRAIGTDAGPVVEVGDDALLTEALDALATAGTGPVDTHWVVLTDSTAERLKAGAIARALARAGRRIGWLEARTRTAFPDLALSAPLVGLPLLAAGVSLAPGGRAPVEGAGLARRVARLAQVLQARRPAGLLVFGHHDWATTALFVARRLDVPTLRVLPSARPVRGGDPLGDRALGDVLAEHTVTEAPPEAAVPGRNGLLAEVLGALGGRWPADADLLGGLRMPDGWSPSPGQYAVAVDLDTDPAVGLDRWLGPLTSVGRRLPVLWWVSAAQATALHGSGWLRRLAERRVHVLADIGYLQGLRLLRDAAALIGAGCREWTEEAEAFGVPRLDFAALHQALLRPASVAGSLGSLAEARARSGAVPAVPMGAAARLARQILPALDEPVTPAASAA